MSTYESGLLSFFTGYLEDLDVVSSVLMYTEILQKYHLLEVHSGCCSVCILLRYFIINGNSKGVVIPY